MPGFRVSFVRHFDPSQVDAVLDHAAKMAEKHASTPELAAVVFRAAVDLAICGTGVVEQAQTLPVNLGALARREGH